MNGQPHDTPANPSPNAPNQPQHRTDTGGKLGRERPGEGLDTGFDTDDLQPGRTGGEKSPLND